MFSFCKLCESSQILEIVNITENILTLFSYSKAVLAFLVKHFFQILVKIRQNMKHGQALKKER